MTLWLRELAWRFEWNPEAFWIKTKINLKKDENGFYSNWKTN